jgi:hypothetical protein
MKANSALRALVLSSLVLLSGILASSVAAAELAGTWTLSIETPRGLSNPTLEVVETEGVYAGTYNSARGPIAIEQITKDGNQFQFPLVITIPIGDISVNYKGHIEGDAMTGLVQNPRGEVPFSGVRN